MTGLRISVLGSDAEGANGSNSATPRPSDTEDAYGALFEIGTQIQAEESNLAAVLDLIVEKASELVGADVGWLALLDGDGPTMRIGSSVGARGAAFTQMTLEIGTGVGGVALARQETIVVTDYATYVQDTPKSVRSAIEEEGIVSVICAPMLRDGRMVGALYVGNRDVTDFGGRQASLVTALASQASIAIENSRLLDQLAAKNEMLGQSHDIHRRLTDASLDNAGLDGVATTLSDLLERALVLEQEVVPPFRRAVGTPPPDGATIGASMPIVAGKEDLGRVLVLGGAPLHELGRRALQHGTTILAVELLRHRTAQAVEHRLGGELLAELLERSGPVDRRLTARAARFGIDLSGAHRIAVLETSDDVVDERTIRVAAAGAMLVGSSKPLVTTIAHGRIVVALPADLDAQIDEVLAAVMSAATAAGTDGCTCAVGLSRATTDLPRAMREGLACARFAALSGKVEAVVRADELGAMRFLFALDNPLPLREYVDEQLGPLLDRGRDEMQLVRTLRAFLAADGHHATIAERCEIHKSTVKYRLGRISEILGRPLADADVRFELKLAIALADVLNTLALSPALDEWSTDHATHPHVGSS